MSTHVLTRGHARKPIVPWCSRDARRTKLHSQKYAYADVAASLQKG
jgi:hypothetical protein